MEQKRRLIEHRLPLKEISEASAREKSIRHGHISTLHIWWARRPLAASRAAVFATLVPDTEENYQLVKRIVPWEAVKDGNSKDILEARRRVLEVSGGTPPRVLDPFAGGGAIPLEALRLGCETHALDINPVAYLILKATLEYPQRFGQPDSRAVPTYIRALDQAHAQAKDQAAQGTTRLLEEGGEAQEEGPFSKAYRENPLAAEVRYWGEWVLERARQELAQFYPKDPDGRTPVAYLWARTVTCTNPTCRAEVPLVRQWWLAKKDKKRIALKPLVDREAKRVDFQVVEVPQGEDWPDQGTIQRGNAACLVCGTVVPVENVRSQAKQGNWGERMLAVVLAEGGEGKAYRPANDEDRAVFERARARLAELQASHTGELSLVPDEPLPPKGTLGFRVNLYGIQTWGQLFNPRQALALVTFAKWVRESHAEMLRQGMDAELAKAVATYLAIVHDRVTDKNASLVVWDNTRDNPTHVFGRQALPMVWDYAEINPLASNGWPNALDWVWLAVKSISLVSEKPGIVDRGTATRLPFPEGYFDAVVTDPPYYDAVPYADLSDFFYVWLRRTVGHLYPEHFRTPLTPKGQEAVQNPVRHGGDNEKAKRFFEEMMGEAFREMHRVLKPEGKATVVFAHKSTEAWETLISALIGAGFQVEASWPLQTEMQTRLRARGSAALASSTFLSCTKRVGQGTVGLFAQVREEMQKTIQPRLEEFWDSGIRAADFFMAAIGPGLEAFSRYDEVRRADGRRVEVGEFLDEVRKIVLEFALERVLGAEAEAGAVDGPTQFALLTLWAYGLEAPSDEARKIAQSTGVSLPELGSLVRVEGEKTRIQKARERLKRDRDFGLPRTGPVPMVDALQRAILMLREGREALAQYLEAVGYLRSPAFWLVAQALAEILEGEDEGRDLHELLTLREGLVRVAQVERLL
ncbi:MAG TPA: hypothetical protein DCR99_01135 [Thermus scotoductus]|nr:hypothetical protein [Thermus scotoductus]